MDTEGRRDGATADPAAATDGAPGAAPVEAVVRPALVVEPGAAGRVPGGSGELVRQWVDALEGVVEDGRSRTAALATASPRRRWPWSVGAAVVGAAAGAATVLLVRRLVGQDAPDAQEPEQLQAVVDSALPLPPVAPPPP